MKRIWMWMAALAMGLWAVASTAADRPLVVVELFTSQGCSSCPPADAFLHELAKRNDVLALSMHVDYWDYIGWKDVFAQHDFTLRQHAYAKAGKRQSVYTPQMIVQGFEHVVGNHPKEVNALLGKYHGTRPKVRVSAERKGRALEIRGEAQRPGEMLVLLIRFSPHEKVKIRRGENAGKLLSYSNVVRELKPLARWDGKAPLTLKVPISGSETAAVIVQYRSKAGLGRIAAAALAE